MNCDSLTQLRERVRGIGRKQVFVFVAVLMLAGAGYAATSGGLYTSGATFGTDSGLAIQVQSDQTLAGNPFLDARTFDGDGGTVEATSTGDAYVEVQSWGAGGATTVVQNLSLTNTSAIVNPDNSDQLGLNGTASEVSWDNTTADDGASDFSVTISGSETAGVIVYELDPDSDYLVVDGGGNVVDRSTSDSNGAARFDVSSTSTLTVKSYDNALPTVTNLNPDGDVVGSTVTLNATVDDDSLPGSDVTVTFRVEGSTVHEETITSAGEVNYTLTSGELPPAGESSWSVTATDELGGETTESSTFVVPGNVTVWNVSNTSEAVAGANVTIYTDETSYTRTTDVNGNFSLNDLPANEVLVFEVNATDYHERTMAIPSVVQAGGVYLIPENTTTVLDRFTIDDATGEFSTESVVYVKRPITQDGVTTYRTVSADHFGVEGFSATLEEGQRYRITIISQDGDVAQLGKFVADVSEEVPLRPQTVAVQLADGDALYYAANTTDTDLQIRWLDPQEETEVLTVSVVNRFNDSDYLLKPTTYYGTNSLSLSEPINGSLQDSYIVVLEGQRDGEAFNIRIPLGPDQRNIIPGGLDTVWIQIMGIGLVLVVGGTFSRLNLAAGVVITSLFGSILWYLGFLTGVATWATVALAITFSVVYAMVIHR